MFRRGDEARGFPTDKIEKSMIQGLLKPEDLDFIEGVLTEDLDPDDMAEVLTEVKGVTLEAASILVKAWFDGGRSNKDWPKYNLRRWVLMNLAGKMMTPNKLAGTNMNDKLNGIADRVAAAGDVVYEIWMGKNLIWTVMEKPGAAMGNIKSKALHEAYLLGESSTKSPYIKGGDIFWRPNGSHAPKVLYDSGGWTRQAGLLDESSIKTGLPGPFERERLFNTIRPGARVTIVTPHDSKLTGRAVMRGPAGWVLNLGGPHGTPGIATDENVIAVRGGRTSMDQTAASKYQEGDVVKMTKDGKEVEVEIKKIIHKGGKYVYEVEGEKEPVPQEILKRAASREAHIASSVMASEVVNEMVRQIRAFAPKQMRALLKVFGVPFALYGFVKQGDDTVAVRYKSTGTENEVMAGFKLKYDYGMDTYILTPFFVDSRGATMWGKDHEDFYVEDLGDTFKLGYIFEEVKPIGQPETAKMNFTVYGLGQVHERMTFGDEKALVIGMRKLGIHQIGVSSSPRLRPELQGKPMFDKLVGPMWDGSRGVRYETSEVNDRLST